jgi:AraC-like DNA-binding protein
MRNPNRILYAGRSFTLGEFRCPPESPRWRRVNVIGELSLAAFPATSVVIHQNGREPVLANPNHVIFYRGGQRYRRILHDGRGDRCVYIDIYPELVQELLAAVGLDQTDLPFVHGPSNAQAYLRLRLSALALAEGRIDPLAVDETVYFALLRSIEDSVAVHRSRRRAARTRTEHDHHRIVEEAKALLMERARRNDPLELLARELHVSEFHLARIFRERTGFTLNRYRTHLRLRLALDRLAVGDANLATVAIELGFNSHSHFSDVFGAVFGAPPSDVRAALGRRGLRELSRMLDQRSSLKKKAAGASVPSGRRE